MKETTAQARFDRAAWVRNKPADAVFVVPVDEGPLCAPQDWAERCYRCFEWLMTLAGFIVVLPVMLIVGLVIRLESPGPAVFVLYRVGQSVPMQGRDIMHRKDLYPSEGPFDPDKLYYVPQSFRFLKFCTMHSDARERFPELYDDRIDYDLEYARTRTISLDLKIIFDTVKGVMLRKGAF